MRPEGPLWVISGHQTWQLQCPLYPDNGHQPLPDQDLLSANRRHLPPTGAALLLGERMLEEKTKHFLCCVRSSRISEGARRAASGPCVSGSVDIPVL